VERKRGSGYSIEEKGCRSLGVLASDIACDNHKIPLKECNGDSVKKSRGFMQNRTICANPSTHAVDTTAIQDSELLRMVKKLSVVGLAEIRSHMPNTAGELCVVDVYGPLSFGRGGVLCILICLDVFTKFVKLFSWRAATTRACLHKNDQH
jgi:hypothetical protein